MSSTSSFRTFFGGGANPATNAPASTDTTTSTTSAADATVVPPSMSATHHHHQVLQSPSSPQSSSGDRAVLLMHLQNIQLALSSLPPRPSTATNNNTSTTSHSTTGGGGGSLLSRPQVKLLRSLTKSTNPAVVDAALDVTITNTMNKLTAAFGAASGAWGGVWDPTQVLGWEPSVLLLLSSGVLPTTTASSSSSPSGSVNVSGVSSVLNALLQTTIPAQQPRVHLIHSLLRILMGTSSSSSKNDNQNTLSSDVGVVEGEDPVSVVSRAVRALRSNLLGDGASSSSLSPIQLLHPFLLAVALLGGPSHRMLTPSSSPTSSSSPLSQQQQQHLRQQQKQHQQRQQQYNAGVEAVLGVAVAALQALIDSPSSPMAMFTPQTLCLTSEVVLMMIRTLVVLPTPTASKPHRQENNEGVTSPTTSTPTITPSPHPITKSSSSSTPLNESLLHRLLHLSLALVRHPATSLVPEAMVVNLVHASLLVATNGSAQIRQGVVVMVAPQHRRGTSGASSSTVAMTPPTASPATTLTTKASNDTMMMMVYTATHMSVSDLLRGSAELMCLDMVSAALSNHHHTGTSCNHGPNLLGYAAALIRFPTFDIGSPDDYHNTTATSSSNSNNSIVTNTIYYASVDRCGEGSGSDNGGIVAVTPVVQLHGIGLTQSILHRTQPSTSSPHPPSPTMLRLQQVVRSGLSRALLSTTNPTASPSSSSSASALNSVAVALLGDAATSASLLPVAATHRRQEKGSGAGASESSSPLIHLPVSSSLTSRLGCVGGDHDDGVDAVPTAHLPNDHALKVMCLLGNGEGDVPHKNNNHSGVLFRHPSKLYVQNSNKNSTTPYRVYLVLDGSSLRQELDAITMQREQAARHRQALEELTSTTSKNGAPKAPTPQQQTVADSSSSGNGNSGTSSSSSEHNIVILSQLLRTLHLVLDFNVSDTTTNSQLIEENINNNDDDADDASSSSSSDLGGYDNTTRGKKQTTHHINGTGGGNGSLRRSHKGPYASSSTSTTVLKTLQTLEGALLEPIQELLAPTILTPVSSLGHSSSYLLSYLLAFEQVQHSRSITLNSIPPADGGNDDNNEAATSTTPFSSTLIRAVSDLVDHVSLLLPPHQPQGGSGAALLSDQSTAGSPTVEGGEGASSSAFDSPAKSTSANGGGLILPSSNGTGGVDDEALSALSAQLSRSDAIDDTICHLITAAPAMSLLYSSGGHSTRPPTTHALSSYDGPISSGLSKEEYAMLPHLLEGSSNCINTIHHQQSSSMSMLDRSEAVMRSYLKLSRMRKIVLSGLLHGSGSSDVATTTVVGTLPDPHFDHAADLAAGHLITDCAHPNNNNNVSGDSKMPTRESVSTPASPTTSTAPSSKFTTEGGGLTNAPSSASLSATAPTDLDHLHTSVLVESLSEFCSAPLFAPYCLLHYDLSPIHTTVFRGASAHTTTDSGGVCGQKGIMQEEGGGGTVDACESNILPLASILASEPTAQQQHQTTITTSSKDAAAVAVVVPTPSSSLVAALPKISTVPLRPGQRPLSLAQIASQSVLNDIRCIADTTIPYYAVSRLGLDAAQHELQTSAALAQQLSSSLASTSSGEDGGEVDVSVAALDRFLGACQSSLLSGGGWDPITSTFLGSSQNHPKAKSATHIDAGTFHAPLLESILTFLLRAVVQASVGSSTRTLNASMSTTSSSDGTTLLHQLLDRATSPAQSNNDVESSSSFTQGIINERLLLTSNSTTTSTDPVVLRLAQQLLVEDSESGSGVALLSDKIREAHAILWGVAEKKQNGDNTKVSSSSSPLAHLNQLAAKHVQDTAIKRRLEQAEVLYQHHSDLEKDENVVSLDVVDHNVGNLDSVLSQVVRPLMELSRISNGPGGLALQALSSLVENLQQRQQQHTPSSQSTEAFDNAVRLARYRSHRIRAFATLFNAREWKKALSLLMEADDPSILPPSKSSKASSSWSSKKNCLGITRPAACTGMSVAKFLYNNRHALDRQVIGDFIGELGKECHEVNDKDLRRVFEPFLQSEMMASGSDNNNNNNTSPQLTPTSPTTSTGFTVELVRARWDEEFAQRYPMSIPFMDTLLKGFLSCFKFTLKPLLRSIREVVHEVGLPGESQKIDRVMEAFAMQWHRDNAVPPPLPSSPPPHTTSTSPGRRNTSPTPSPITTTSPSSPPTTTTSDNTNAEAAVRRYNEHRASLLAVNPFKGTDAAFILSFSLIMLNTDLHSGKLAKTMTVQDFRSMNRGIDEGGASLPEAFLTALYHDIKGGQIVMLDHAAKHMANVQREVTDELKEAAIYATTTTPPSHHDVTHINPDHPHHRNNGGVVATTSTNTTTYPLSWNKGKAALGDGFGILPIDSGIGGVTHLPADGAFLACAASSDYAPDVDESSSPNNNNASSPGNSTVNKGRMGANNNTNATAANAVPLTPQARLEQVRAARIKKIADSTRVLYNTVIPTATSNAHLVVASTNPGIGCYNDSDDDGEDESEYNLLTALQTSSATTSSPSDGIAQCVDPYLLQTIWQPATAAFLAVMDTTLSALSGLDMDIGGRLNTSSSRRYLVRSYMMTTPDANNNMASPPSSSSSLMAKYTTTSAIYSMVSSLCGPSASGDLTAAINGLLGLIDASVRMHSNKMSGDDIIINTRVISSILLTFLSEHILPALRGGGVSNGHDDNDVVFEDPQWLIYYDLVMFLVSEIQLLTTTSSSSPASSVLLTPPVLDAVAEMSALLFQRGGYNIMMMKVASAPHHHNHPISSSTTPLERLLASNVGSKKYTPVRRQRCNLPEPPSSSTSRRSGVRGSRKGAHAITNNDSAVEGNVAGGGKGGWLSGLWGREASAQTQSSQPIPSTNTAAPLPVITTARNQSTRHQKVNPHHASATRRIHSDLLFARNTSVTTDSNSGMIDPNLILPFLMRRASVPTHTPTTIPPSQTDVADGISLLKFIATTINNNGDDNRYKDAIAALAGQYVALTRGMVEKCCMGLFHQQHGASSTTTHKLVILGEMVSEWSRLGREAVMVHGDLISNTTIPTTSTPSSPSSPSSPPSSSSMLYSEVSRSHVLLASLLTMPEDHHQHLSSPTTLLGGVQHMVWPALIEALHTLRAHTHISLRSSTLVHSKASVTTVPQPVVDSVLSLVAAIHHAGAEVVVSSSSASAHSAAAAVRELAFVSLVAVTEMILLPQQHSGGVDSPTSSSPLICTCDNESSLDDVTSNDNHHPTPTAPVPTPDGLNSDEATPTSPTPATTVPCVRCALVRAVVELLSDTLPTITSTPTTGPKGDDSDSAATMCCAEALSVLACASTYLHQTTSSSSFSSPSNNNAISEMCIVGLQRCLLSATSPSSTAAFHRMFDGMLFPILDLLSNGPPPGNTDSTHHHHHKHHHRRSSRQGGGAEVETAGEEDGGAMSLMRRYDCTRMLLQGEGSVVPQGTRVKRSSGGGKSTAGGSSSSASDAARGQQQPTPTPTAGGRLTGFFSPTTLLSTVFGPMAGPRDQAASSTNATQQQQSSSNTRQSNEEEEGDEAFNIFSRALSMTFRVFAHWAPSAFHSHSATPSTRHHHKMGGPADAERVWKRLLGMCYALASPLPPTATTADPLLLYASFPVGAVADLVEANVRNALRELLRSLPKSLDDSDLKELWKTTSQALTMFTWYAGSEEETLLADRL